MFAVLTSLTILPSVKLKTFHSSAVRQCMLDKILSGLGLTLSKTSPGLYVSAIKVF